MATLSWGAGHCPKREAAPRRSIGIRGGKKKAPETGPEPSTWVSGQTRSEKPDEPQWAIALMVQSR